MLYRIAAISFQLRILTFLLIGNRRVCTSKNSSSPIRSEFGRQTSPASQLIIILPSLSKFSMNFVGDLNLELPVGEEVALGIAKSSANNRESCDLASFVGDMEDADFINLLTSLVSGIF